MEIKKTVGTDGIESDRRDYVIHTACGEEFYAKAVGSQGYECRGESFKSVKDIKASIANDRFSEGGDPASETSTIGEGFDLWECCHPCAAMILPNVPKEVIHRILDCFGWLDENGNPDVVRAQKELERTKNIPQEVQTDE